MIDTHCHLTDPRLIEQLDAVLERAGAAGVADIVTIGTHPADWEAALAVTKRHPNVRCAVAHPNYCHEIQFEELERLRGFPQPGRRGAGGDGIGLSLRFVAQPKQAEYFEAQLRPGAGSSMPVVIHCREAVADCLAMLQRFSG